MIFPGISAIAQDQSALEIAEKIQARYARIESLSFNFAQSTSGQMTGRPKIGEGSALLAKPGIKTLMRWNYLTPEHQVVISDGTTVSMYFEKLNQLIISSVDQARSDVLFSFFSGKEPLEDNFSVLPAEVEMDIQAAKDLADLQVIQLQPRDADTQIRTVHLWVGQDALIRRIELLDFFDTKTTITLSNIRENPLDLSDQADLDRRFRFTPPEGTEIIRQ